MDGRVKPPPLRKSPKPIHDSLAVRKSIGDGDRKLPLLDAGQRNLVKAVVAKKATITLKVTVRRRPPGRSKPGSTDPAKGSAHRRRCWRLEPRRAKTPAKQANFGPIQNAPARLKTTTARRI